MWRAAALLSRRLQCPRPGAWAPLRVRVRVLSRLPNPPVWFSLGWYLQSPRSHGLPAPPQGYRPAVVLDGHLAELAAAPSGAGEGRGGGGGGRGILLQTQLKHGLRVAGAGAGVGSLRCVFGGAGCVLWVVRGRKEHAGGQRACPNCRGDGGEGQCLLSNPLASGYSCWDLGRHAPASPGTDSLGTALPPRFPT